MFDLCTYLFSYLFIYLFIYWRGEIWNWYGDIQTDE